MAKKKLPSFGGMSRGQIVKSELRRRTIGKPNPVLQSMSFGDIFKAEIKRRFVGGANYATKQSVPKGMGTAGEAMGRGARGGGKSNTSSSPPPNMETPQTVNNVSNPTIATITNQLNQLVATANSIGLLTKEQQEILLNQISQSNRISQETQLESGIGDTLIPEGPSAGIAEALTPITDAMEGLSDRLESLISVINDKLDDQGDDGDIGGGGKGKKGKPKKVSRARAKFEKGLKPEQLLDKNGKALTGAAKESRIAKLFRESEALAKPSFWSRITGGIGKALGSSATRVAGAGATVASSLSSRFAGMLGTGVRAAGARAAGTAGRVLEKSALMGTVRRIALPLVEKAVGKTVLKSIPILGAAAGIGFAISRLAEGDWKGAGLEAASGLAGPLSSLGLLGVILARDMYSDVFGVKPEEDPEVGSKMAMLKDMISDIIKEVIGPAVTVKKPPSTSDVEKITTPTTPISTPSDQNIQPQQSLSGNAPTPAPAKAASSSAAASAESGQASTSGETSGTPSRVGPDFLDGVPMTEPKSGKQLQEAEQMPSQAATGQYINAQEIPVDDEWKDYGYVPQQNMFFPQKDATPKGGVQGVGHIPDPVYRATNISGILQTLYFNYRAQ